MVISLMYLTKQPFRFYQQVLLTSSVRNCLSRTETRTGRGREPTRFSLENSEEFRDQLAREIMIRITRRRLVLSISAKIQREMHRDHRQARNSLTFSCALCSRGCEGARVWVRCVREKNSPENRDDATPCSFTTSSRKSTRARYRPREDPRGRVDNP